MVWRRLEREGALRRRGEAAQENHSWEGQTVCDVEASSAEIGQEMMVKTMTELVRESQGKNAAEKIEMERVNYD